MQSVRRGLFGLFMGTALSGGTAFAQAPAGDAVDELVVVGQRLSQQRAIDYKRDSAGVADAISADEIGRLPDKNAAENLERLPGVSLKYDQGEGRFVSIRGVDGALNNVTVNGVQTGSPEAGSRNLPMDVLGGQLTSRIEVIKAVTPDMDAQGIGGTVNLVTQSPFDFKKSVFAQGSFAYGGQELNDKHPIQGDATIGALFGDRQQFGFVAGVNYSDREYRTYGMYPDDWRPVAGAARGMPTNLKNTTYELDRERLGVNASLEYRPSPQDKIFLRGFYSNLNENEYRQRYRLDFGADGRFTLNADGRTGVSTAVERRQDLRLQIKDKTIFTGMLGGEHVRGEWTGDYSLSYGRNDLDDHDQNWQFRGGALTVDFDMGPLLYKATPRAEARPQDIVFNQYTNKQTDGSETTWTGALNLRRELDVGARSYLKFGFKYRDTKKLLDVENPTYARATAVANRFSLADADLLGPPTYSYLGDATYPNFPTVDREAVPAYVAQNLNTARVALNAATTLSQGVLSDFDAGEKVAAGYAMASFSFGRLTVLGGLRVEDTRTDVSGFQLTNGTTVTAVRRENAYTHILPGLHLRFEPSETVVLRAAFTNTVGRPEYSQLSPGSTFTYTPLADGRNDGAISEGNPGLKPYLSYNLDGSAEWYFARGGLASMGVFYKRIENPIFTYRQTLRNTTYLNLAFDTLAYDQPRNADRGEIYGVEFNYQQQFRFLPGAFGGLGVAGNVTLTGSSLTSPARTDELKFPKQSKLLYGGQLFYQKYGIEATLSYHYSSSYQDTIGASAQSDTFFNHYRRLDAKVSYALTPKVNVFFEAQNLNDEILWEYQGGRKDWQIGYERYGRTFYVGFSGRW